MKQFKITTLDKVSSAGGEVNEDGFFDSSRRAWLLDGASGLSGHSILGTGSDAQRFVKNAIRVISQFDDEPFSVQPMLLAEELNRDFLLEVTEEKEEQYEKPSASLVAVEIQGSQLLYGQLGDCSAIFQARPNSEVLSTLVSPLADLDNLVLEKLKALQIHSNKSLSAAREQILDDLRANRSKMNLPSGYSALTVGNQNQFVFEPKSFAVSAGSMCLMMSDGFSRLIDTFHVYTKESILHSATKNGLDQLLNELRKLENQDPEGGRYTRFKRHDDASALLLQVTEH